MRSRCSVAVIAALIASSLLPTPAKLADASADVPNPLEYISRPQTLDAPDGAVPADRSGTWASTLGPIGTTK